MSCLCISLNGVPACANKKLLRQILRDEWNFTGYVVSDEYALEFIVSGHHYLKDATAAAAASIKAGCNLELTSVKHGHIFESIPQVCLKFLDDWMQFHYKSFTNLWRFASKTTGKSASMMAKKICPTLIQ